MQTSPSPINSKALIALAQRDELFAKALKLATKLYKKQKRAYTGVEYVSHPMTVISLLLSAPIQPAALYAAALEEILSKTALKVETLRAEFGDAVADMVIALTPEADLDAYCARLAQASFDVKTVKLASLLDHICAIPPKKLSAAKPFLADCSAMAKAVEGGDESLARLVQLALGRIRAKELAGGQ